MKVKKIRVDHLFGIYKYELTLVDPSFSHVTIIDAPNGMGKTTLLRLIHATLSGDIVYLDSIPFSTFEIDFDDGQYVRVIKKNVYDEMLSKELNGIRNHLAHSSNGASFEKISKDFQFNNIIYMINGAKYEVSLQQEFIMNIIRRYRIITRDSNRGLSIADIMKREEYNSEDIFMMDELMVALDDISKDFNIYFIKTNRLYRRNEEAALRVDKFRGRADRNDMVSAVELYKEKIKSNIISTGKEFADKSEELDRTFPQRVLKTIFDNSIGVDIYTKEEIEQRLNDLEEKRASLSALGLITNAGDSLVRIPSPETLTNETKIFLTNYIKDSNKKLEIYKDLSDKLKLLQSIVNERNAFSDKQMKFSSDEGVSFISKNGRIIPIDKLSSGEKNNFVLFYELIFSCGKHTLILVDEPEISLHVAWQRKFIDELNEICQLKGLQGIVATHSPDIVGDNVDFMIDLEDISNG